MCMSERERKIEIEREREGEDFDAIRIFNLVCGHSISTLQTFLSDRVILFKAVTKRKKNLGCEDLKSFIFHCIFASRDYDLFTSKGD